MKGNKTQTTSSSKSLAEYIYWLNRYQVLGSPHGNNISDFEAWLSEQRQEDGRP